MRTVFCDSLSLQIAVWACVSLAGAVVGAEMPVKQPPVTKFAVRAMPEPSPALKYQLLPTFRELTPGNAALVYTKIAMEFHSPTKEERELLYGKMFGEWFDMPVDKLPRTEVEAALAKYAHVLTEADRAARMETCEWQLAVRTETPWAVRLPEVQQMRNIARLLHLQLRLAIADRKYDEAIRSFQTGFAISRHVAQGPTIVNGLVGLAMAGILFSEIDDFMRAPDAPNLYWALMALPRPLIDLRPGFDAEIHFIDFAFPKLVDVDSANYSHDEWRKLLRHVATAVPELLSERPASGFFQTPEVMATGLSIKTYTRAKRSLVAGGLAPAEVEAMPVAQVVLRGMVHDYQRIRDQDFKWWYVPYWQHGDGPRRASDAEKAAERDFEGYPFVSLISALSAAQVAQVRGERTVAIHAAVEALRIHAAANVNKLPARLSDVTLAPILNDPVTGQPFNYTLSGRTATLTSPAPSGLPPDRHALHYEITIEP